MLMERREWRTVDAVAIELKSGIVKNEVNTTTSLVSQVLDSFPKLRQMISEDVFLSGSEMITASRLEFLDILFSHVDQERKIGRVSP